MRYTLEVTFKCLCFFVPEQRDGGARMHVLLPNTSGHVHGAHAHHDGDGGPRDGTPVDGYAESVEKHAVRLVFPRAGGKLALKENGKLGVAEGGEGIADFVELDEGAGWQLHLPGEGGADPTLPSELARLGPVQPEVLETPNHPAVISRVVLNAGRATAQRSPALWNYQGRNQPLAQDVVWTIPDLEGDALEWHCTRPDASERMDLPSVQAVDGLVSIALQHVTATEFPTPSGTRHPNQNAAHFTMYGPLLAEPRVADAVPVFVRLREGRTSYCLSGGS